MKTIILLMTSLGLLPNAMAGEPSILISMLSQELMMRSAQNNAAMGEDRLLSQVEDALEEGANPNQCAEEAFGKLLKGDCPLHLALMIGDPKVVRALVKAGADVNTPKPVPANFGNSARANQLREILTPKKMLAFRKKNAIDRRTAIERALDENPVNESERRIIQGQAMPTRLESDLQAVNAQITRFIELEAALKE